MKSINRIPAILEVLGRIWVNSPDLRLGQIIVGACQGKKLVIPPDFDIFHVEDDSILEALEEYLVLLEKS